VRAGADAGNGPVCIPKNSQEEIQAALSEFRGHRLVSLRLWWRKEDSGPFLPSRRGFAIRADDLPTLIEGLRRLEATAIARGWIEQGEAADSTTQRHTRAMSVHHGHGH